MPSTPKTKTKTMKTMLLIGYLNECFCKSCLFNAVYINIYIYIYIDYGAEIHFCNECYEKEDELTILCKYFKEKYNEPLTLVEIQKIIKSKPICA